MGLKLSFQLALACCRRRGGMFSKNTTYRASETKIFPPPLKGDEFDSFGQRTCPQDCGKEYFYHILRNSVKSWQIHIKQYVL